MNSSSLLYATVLPMIFQLLILFATTQLLFACLCCKKKKKGPTKKSEPKTPGNIEEKKQPVQTAAGGPTKKEEPKTPGNIEEKKQPVQAAAGGPTKKNEPKTPGNVEEKKHKHPVQTAAGVSTCKVEVKKQPVQSSDEDEMMSDFHVPLVRSRPEADDDGYRTLAEVLGKDAFKTQKTQSKTSKTKSTTTTAMAELDRQPSDNDSAADISNPAQKPTKDSKRRRKAQENADD